MITIEVKTNLAELDAARAALAKPRRILAAAAQAVAKTLKRHFLARETEPNAFGWRKRHFWKREGFDNTAVDTASITDERATVLVSSRAIAHKLKGGTIRPGPGKKALAIPLTERAYLAGSPRLGVIPGLFLLKRGKDQFMPRAFLATKGEDGKPQVQYLLVPSVTQRADPRTLPEPPVLQAAAQQAAEAVIARARQAPVAGVA